MLYCCIVHIPLHISFEINHLQGDSVTKKISVCIINIRTHRRCVFMLIIPVYVLCCFVMSVPEYGLLRRNSLEDVNCNIVHVQHIFCQKLQLLEMIYDKYTCNLRNVCNTNRTIPYLISQVLS